MRTARSGDGEASRGGHSYALALFTVRQYSDLAILSHCKVKLMPKAAIYCRISSDVEGLEAGVKRQEDDCRAMADRDGLTVVEVYVDNDAGASTRSRKPRPQYAEMMAEANRGAFDFILAYSNSRLTRRPMELEAIITMAERTGTKVRTVVSGQDDLATADGRMVARIKASVDAGEAERTAERVARAHLESARQGKHVSGYRPFGWERDGITERPEEVALIRKAVSDILDGVPLRTIASDWNERGVTTSTGRKWSPSTLKQMIRSPRLAGWRIHQGKVAVDRMGEPVRGQWEPLIEQLDHERLVAMFDARTRRTALDGRQRKYLLSGLVRCGKCSAPMYGARRKDYTYYVCNNPHASERHALGVSAPGVDRLILGLVWEKLAEADVEVVVNTQWEGEARLGEIQERIDSLMQAFREGRMSDTLAFANVEQLETERRALQMERGRWLTESIGPRIERFDCREWFGVMHDALPNHTHVEVKKAGEGFDNDRRRALIDRWLSGVLVLPARRHGNTFDPDRIVPVWREGGPSAPVAQL